MNSQERAEYIVCNWDKMTVKELARDLRVTKGTVYAIVSKARKNGIRLEAAPRGARKVDWNAIKKLI